MTKQQKSLVALMCVIAAVLAALMLWRPPAVPAGQGHETHEDSHGHDDREEEAKAEADEGKTGPWEQGGIAMSEAQIKANIAIDAAGPAMIREQLHLPAQVKVNAERTVALASPAQGIVQSVPVSHGSTVKNPDFRF